MPERITIVIEPSDDHGGFLTVQDAMRQVLDFIDVATAAASDDARPKFKWRLVSATTNSPFTTIAEAVSADPEWPDIESEALHAVVMVELMFREVLDEGRVPDWLTNDDKEKLRSLLRRNVNGIAKTTIDFGDGEPPVILVERRARAALEKIELFEATKVAQAIDYSGEELGSVDGHVIEATTHYGKPALRIRSRLSGDKITCVFTPALAEEIGRQHGWHEVWQGKRVLLIGKMKRSQSGNITFISVEQMKAIEPDTVNEAALDSSNVTDGRGIHEYLDELWDGPIGEN